MKNILLIILFYCTLYSSSSLAEIVYVHNDVLGSPIMETNESGVVIDRFHYKPFGETLGEMKEDVGYTGHLNDTDLDLTYMQARYYDPVIGRFYSNDPVGAIEHLGTSNGIHGFNRYSYANNNPYKYTDPTGQSSLIISPKFTPRLTPVARGVRQGIQSGQSKSNNVQQQTQKIANQMRETVENSKPEIRQSSIKEAPKSPADTTGGIVSRLIKQLAKHADDFAGGNSSTTTTSPDASSSENMSNDTKSFIGEAQILMAPPEPPPELKEPEVI